MSDFRPPSIEEVDEKIAFYDQKIKELQAFVESKRLWENYKSSLLQVLGLNSNGSRQTASATTDPPAQKSNHVGSRNDTARLARAVLVEAGVPMSLQDMVTKMCS